ncbi:hypothetical protein [Streptomyces sp. NPDC007205]|uniref:hypothetical protein n=1 Tax=Streptomyces sp. NPDC007205 TaxID=3154316 RepID=UPI0033EAA075
MSALRGLAVAAVPAGRHRPHTPAGHELFADGSGRVVCAGAQVVRYDLGGRGPYDGQLLVERRGAGGGPGRQEVGQGERGTDQGGQHRLGLAGHLGAGPGRRTAASAGRSRPATG